MVDQADCQENLRDEVERIGGDIIGSARFAKAYKVPHHNKNCSIASHSLETATYALGLARWLKQHDVELSEEDVVRASLLHDIGMTEDDVFLSPSHVKAYSHPREGARIAQEEFGANEVQVDAIRRHMWPIGMVAPHSAEGWVVVAADKYCSAREVQREVDGHLSTLRRRR